MNAVRCFMCREDYLGTFSRNADSEQVQLDLGVAVFFLFGIQWNF